MDTLPLITHILYYPSVPVYPTIAYDPEGRYLLIEYKGEDRLSNDDTTYKVKLGELWEKICNNGNKFYLASKANSEDIVKTIATIA
ncbi:MAG: hypothetical protein ACR2LN_03310 [Candidatus Levyibacteriota bacterium]